LLVSVTGGALGLCASLVLLRGLNAWHPVPRFSVMPAVNPDAQIYGIALVLVILSALLFGGVPIRQVRKVDAYQVIKSGPAAMAGRRLTVRDLLLGIQITICALLITSSIVAVRGLMRSLDADFGFEPRNMILAETVLDMAGYSGEAVPAMQRRMLDAVQKISRVNGAGMVVRRARRERRA